MPTLDEMMQKPVRIREQMAMGVNATVSGVDGFDAGKKSDPQPKMSRGPGRAPDGKSSSMPKCDPETAPFWAGAKDVDVGPDKVKVAGHTRSKPIGNRPY